MIKLGDKVKDTVTGFTGVAVARTEWLNGCTRWNIQPPMKKDGTLPQCESFDEPQLEVLKPSFFSRKTDTGGPRPEPQRQPTIRR